MQSRYHFFVLFRKYSFNLNLLWQLISSVVQSHFPKRFELCISQLFAKKKIFVHSWIFDIPCQIRARFWSKCNPLASSFSVSFTVLCPEGKALYKRMRMVLAFLSVHMYHSSHIRCSMDTFYRSTPYSDTQDHQKYPSNHDYLLTVQPPTLFCLPHSNPFSIHRSGIGKQIFGRHHGIVDF